MKKLLLIIIVLVLAGGLIYSIFLFANKKDDHGYSASEVVTGVADLKIKEKADSDLAIIKAKELYRIAFYNGDDLSSGPCLSNEVVPGWVADIAHNPRQAVDDLPANQCSAFHDGTAKHFVELDLSGEFIRAE